jgi:hypothetical protein
MLGLLFDRAGLREKAIEQMNSAAGRSELEYDPGALIDVVRWKLEVEQYADARRHAESALQLWPAHVEANRVIKQLLEAEKSE